MDIRKLNNYYELVLDSVNFILDPPSIFESANIILTDINQNLNRNRIFNAQGEYNVGDVYFWGFETKNFITYLFINKEGSLLYSKELNDEVIKKIKIIKREIDALFLIGFFDEKIVSLFNPNLILVNKSINLPKFDKQQGDKLKINLKKTNKLIFMFQ